MLAQKNQKSELEQKRKICYHLAQMKEQRKLLSFRCDEGTYRALQKMSEKNNLSLTMLLNQALLMYCDAAENGEELPPVGDFDFADDSADFEEDI